MRIPKIYETKTGRKYIIFKYKRVYLSKNIKQKDIITFYKSLLKKRKKNTYDMLKNKKKYFFAAMKFPIKPRKMFMEKKITRDKNVIKKKGHHCPVDNRVAKNENFE